MSINRKLFGIPNNLFLMAFILAFMLLSFASAIQTSNANAITYTTNSTLAESRGFNVTIKENSSSIIVTKVFSSNATKVWVYSAAGNYLANGTFSGNNATVNYNFVNGTTYGILLDSGGSAYIDSYAGGLTFPITNSTVTWVNGLYITSFGDGTAKTLNIDSGFGHSITNIWTSGTSTGTDVTLINPATSASLSTSGENFTAYYNMSGTNFSYQWKNATYYVWLSNGTLFNQTTITGLSGNNTYTTQFIDDFSANIYIWNVRACYANATFSNCTFAPSNYTFTVTGFTVNNESYSNTSVEGNTESFVINITITAGFQVSTGYLVYNGVAYAGTFTNLGSGQYSVNRNLIIPAVVSDTNYSFYWSFTLNNGFVSNSTAHNQTVYNIAVDNCAVYTYPLLNFTLKDEELQTVLNGTTQNTTIEVDLSLMSLDGSTSITNYSNRFYQINPARICMQSNLNNSALRLDALVRYTSLDRVDEFYNIQNYTLRNTTIAQNISLYDLLSADSTSFLIIFKDDNFLPVSNALIEITRKYISEGTFKTVEIPKTDNSGQATGHFDLTGAIYTINVYKYGELLGTFDNVAVFCENEVIGDCKLNLNTFSSSADFSDYGQAGDISYTQSFNASTRTLTVTFSTLNGGTQTVNVSVQLITFNGQEITACSDSLTSSAGTLTCTVPLSYGNASVIALLYSNGELITSQSYSISPDPQSYFGGHMYIMLLMLFLTIPLMFITSTIGILIGLVIGLVISAGLILFTDNLVLGVGSALLWGIIVILIIIWKISRRER